MRVNLSDMIGDKLESLDDGGKLYQAIHKELQGGAQVELDFTGVRSIITPFLNASLGKLLDVFEKETLMEKLILCQISTDHLRRVNEFIDSKHQMNSEKTTLEMMKELFEEDDLGDVES